jgi:hypothetical protein
VCRRSGAVRAWTRALERGARPSRRSRPRSRGADRAGRHGLLCGWIAARGPRAGPSFRPHCCGAGCAFHLVRGRSPPPSAPARATPTADGAILEGGGLTVEFAAEGQDLIRRLEDRGTERRAHERPARIVTSTDFGLATSERDLARSVVVERSGPLCARIRIGGFVMDSDDRAVLVWSLRVEAFAGGEPLRFELQVDGGADVGVAEDVAFELPLRTRGVVRAQVLGRGCMRAAGARARARRVGRWASRRRGGGDAARAARRGTAVRARARRPAGRWHRTRRVALAAVRTARDRTHPRRSAAPVGALGAAVARWGVPLVRARRARRDWPTRARVATIARDRACRRPVRLDGCGRSVGGRRAVRGRRGRSVDSSRAARDDASRRGPRSQRRRAGLRRLSTRRRLREPRVRPRTLVPSCVARHARPGVRRDRTRDGRSLGALRRLGTESATSAPACRSSTVSTIGR